MKLLHGTSSVFLDTIQNTGLTTPYLTDSTEVAEYYAMTAVDEEGGDPVVLTVNVDPSTLQADYPAFEEPLSMYLYDYAESEDDWQELLENGTIPYPKDKTDWQTSLAVVRSVKSTQNISPEAIILPLEETAALITTIKHTMANMSPELIGKNIGGQPLDMESRVPTNEPAHNYQHPGFFADELQKEK